MSPELIAWLLSWAVFYTGYDMPQILPTVEVVDHQYFVQILCKGVDTQRHPCNVRGSYDDNETGLIRLNNKFYNGTNSTRRSVVLHEIVHYLQDLTDEWKDMESWQDPIRCQERVYREREAHIVQRQYLKDVYEITIIRRTQFDKCENNYER